MASTAHKTDEEMVEHLEADEVVDAKAEELARCIAASKHFVAFTGAGISTSAGIPDFRGPQGVWTLRAQGKLRTERTVSTLNAHPTFAHMALVALQRAGYLKFLISSNTDGLHLRSGFSPDHICELHGNTNTERCSVEGCEAEYKMDGHTRRPGGVHDHETGRLCTEPGCNGKLMDTIINFNENLWGKQVELAYANAGKADVMLTLGSSLRVSTWAVDEVAKKVKRGKAHLFVCNLQITPYDDVATVIHARTDNVLKRVLEKLGVEIPEYRLHRRIEVRTKRSRTKGLMVAIKGIDTHDRPYHIFRALAVRCVDATKATDATDEKGSKPTTRVPYNAKTNRHEIRLENPSGNVLHVMGTFVGHLNEPMLSISDIPIADDQALSVRTYSAYFSPATETWTVELEQQREI